MARRYEYTVVNLPIGPKKGREQALTELINSVAEHGWRLVAVTADPNPINGADLGYFEREAAQ